MRRYPNQSGFSLLELLLVTVIMGILGNLAVPAYLTAKKRAQAQAIVGDFLVFRTALIDYQARNGSWPRASNIGRMPAELASYLGDRIQWRSPPDARADRLSGSDYMLRYGNWMNHARRISTFGMIVGFGVKTKDVELKLLLEEAYGQPLIWFASDRVYFPIVTTGVTPSTRHRPKS